jgi:hypothetical protein
MGERYAKTASLSTCASRIVGPRSLRIPDRASPAPASVVEWSPPDDHDRLADQVGKEATMLNMRTIALAILVLSAAGPAGAESDEASGKSPKYYFRVSNIQSQDNKIIPMAKELLEKEVASRPEFTMELRDANSEEAEIALLRKQGVKGFQVSMRIASLKKDVKPPAPGKRDPQMSIDVKLTVFGHTIPGNKVLFTGDGDASLMGEFSERLRDKEEERFTRTALASAIKQAVSTAVVKLTTARIEDRGPAKGKKRKGRR